MSINTRDSVIGVIMSLQLERIKKNYNKLLPRADDKGKVVIKNRTFLMGLMVLNFLTTRN